MVAALIAVPLAGPGRAQPPATCTWSIGMMGALGGDFARYAAPAANGVRLAVDLANRERDLACALSVHAEDTEGDPTQAQRKAQRLADDEQVVACICGFFSGETLAAGRVFEDAGLLMASTGTNRIIDEQGYDTWFRAVAADPAQGAGMARYIVETLEARSVVIVHDNQDYSRAFARDIVRGVGDRHEGTYILNPEESDYSALVAKVVRANPDVVFYGGFEPEAGWLLRQLRNEGLRSMFVSGDGAKSRRIRTHLRGYDGRARMRVGCACSDANEIEAAASFAAEYERTYDVRPRRYAADAFDVTNIAIDALSELTGTETVEEARAHVLAYFDAAEDIQGTVKDYTWDDRGELVADDGDVFVWKWLDEAERFEYLGSVAELTATD